MSLQSSLEISSNTMNEQSKDQNQSQFTYNMSVTPIVSIQDKDNDVENISNRSNQSNHSSVVSPSTLLPQLSTSSSVHSSPYSQSRHLQCTTSSTIVHNHDVQPLQLGGLSYSQSHSNSTTSTASVASVASMASSTSMTSAISQNSSRPSSPLFTSSATTSLARSTSTSKRTQKIPYTSIPSSYSSIFTNGNNHHQFGNKPMIPSLSSASFSSVSNSNKMGEINNGNMSGIPTMSRQGPNLRGSSNISTNSSTIATSSNSRQ